MTHILAAEGGYQTFHLSGGEWAILLGSAITALLRSEEHTSERVFRVV